MLLGQRQFGDEDLVFEGAGLFLGNLGLEKIADYTEPPMIATPMTGRCRVNGLLTFVINHDLRQDARNACQMLMAHQRMLPKDFRIAPSWVAITSPH